MGKRKNVPAFVKRLVAAYVLQHEGCTARDIKRDLEKQHKSFRYTERTYQNIRAKLRPLQSELDVCWREISMCKYDLNPAVVPKIVELRAAGMPHNRLTVRGALWMSRFCMLPVSSHALWWIGTEFALAERIREMLKDEEEAVGLNVEHNLHMCLNDPDFCGMNHIDWEDEKLMDFIMNPRRRYALWGDVDGGFDDESISYLCGEGDDWD